MTLRPARVQIRNFRSIADLELDLDPSCQVLLGINEAGKSNILRALSLLDPSTPISEDDRRQQPATEPYDEESSVEFFFPLSDSDREVIGATMLEGVLGAHPVFQQSGSELQFLDLVGKVKELMYYVNLPKKLRVGRMWSLPTSIQLRTGWFVWNSAGPPDGAVRTADGLMVQANGYWLVAEDQFKDPGAHPRLRPATVEDLRAKLARVCRTFVEARLPKCVAWSFQRDRELPNSVPLEPFTQSPGLHPALHNMFALAGVADVASAVAEARNRRNGLRALLERVALGATSFVRAIWPEFLALKIELHENGKQLECMIRDVHGAFDYERRSDGFRRFVGFLLHVSAAANSGGLRDAVLLYDEPDTSLHPSGARKLREELLRLGGANIVVFSTHSTYMVDPSCIARHLIVERKGEVTKVRRATPSIVADEEVLYNAIGCSIFDGLRDRNVVLEGATDRFLLSAAIASRAELATAYATVGICHAGGVKNIAKITPMLQLARRVSLVVSDADLPALQSRKEYAGGSVWVTYVELAGPNFMTAEDFLAPAHIDAVVRKLLAHAPELAHVASTSGDQSYVHFMRRVADALTIAKVDKERRGEVVRLLKDALFASLEPASLRPEACRLAEQVLVKLEASKLPG